MTEPTDTNQASEDEQAMQHICQQTGEHYYASESIPGGLIHWIRICMACGYKDDKDLNEQVKALIRTEKLKLLAEVRELLIDRIPVYDGDDSFGKEYQAGYNSMAHATRTMQLQQSAELTKLEAEL